MPRRLVQVPKLPENLHCVLGVDYRVVVSFLNVVTQQILCNVAQRKVSVPDNAVLGLHWKTEEISDVKHLSVVDFFLQSQPLEIFLDGLAHDHAVRWQDRAKLDQRLF